MNDNPLGKFNQEELQRYVFPHIEKDGRVLSSPRFGSDFNAVRISKDRVLVTSTDPLAISPQLGWERSARLAFHVIASDVAVSGVAPGYLITNWNLPPQISYEEFEKVWSEFAGEARDHKVSVIGGHTGRTADGNFPTVGAGTVFGLGKTSELISSEIEPGDKLYLVNRLGLESVAIFRFYFPQRLGEVLSPGELDAVKHEFDELKPTSILTDLAAGFKYLKKIHDVAEGGLIGGLQELIADRDCGALIKEKSLKIDPLVEKACGYLDLDPLRITSIGSAILVVPGDKVTRFEQAITGFQIELHAIGEIIQQDEILLETQSGTKKIPELSHDEFWLRLEEFMG